LTASGVDSWYHEKESAWLYQRVAAAETDPRKSELFLKLATAAEEQATKWQLAAGRSAAGGHSSERTFTPSLRARVVAQLLTRFDPRSLRPVLAAMKLRGLSIYSAAPSVAGHPMPTSLAEVGARHRSALGGGLRAGVFGVNDGLVSNVSLVLGVAAAGAGAGYVLTAGLAGLLAGALSMAAGEFVSVRSQREMYEYQIALEREELAEYPQEEAEELALIYQARGVELGQARALSQALLANPRQALDVLAREELGLNPDDLGSPWQAAATSFVAFAVGAAVPLIPFLVGARGPQATLGSVVITLASLFAVGLGLSLFTGRHAVRSALRMVLIGGGACAVSFLVGRALGVAIS
jgi:VIT1/CCC1 family predicted Fe2+/Mn2+ transporter